MSFSFPYISWSKMTKRKLIGSLESDFEMVYVAQSCLCWEALQHQYRKVEALASSASLGGAFYDNVGGKLQQFQVLLERFLENERADQKRFWNYVRGRFSMKNLLQVPEITGTRLSPMLILLVKILFLILLKFRLGSHRTLTFLQECCNWVLNNKFITSQWDLNRDISVLLN